MCGGTTVIEVWSTEGSTRVLWGANDSLRVVGDTLQARKLSATRALDGAMTTVTTSLPPLLRRLVQIARDEKMESFVADIHPENRAMQKVAEKVGFKLRYDHEEGLMKAKMSLV